MGSKDNIKHQPGGGDVKILDEKLDFKDKAEAKVGSKDNIEHQPGGGDVQVYLNLDIFPFFVCMNSRN